MFKSLKERAQARRADSNLKKENKESGVSGIIELVIVLVILGILTAILLPTFLGTTSTAKNRSAQSTLSAAVTDAQTAYANSSSSFSTAAKSVSGSVAGAIASSEPGITVVDASAGTTASTTNQIAVLPVSTSQVLVGTWSAGANAGAGGCIWASVNNSSAASTTYGSAGAGVTYGETTGTQCISTSTPASWTSNLSSLT